MPAFAGMSGAGVNICGNCSSHPAAPLWQPDQFRNLGLLRRGLRRRRRSTI